MLSYCAKFLTSHLLGVRFTADRGATAVEYGLMVALIVFAAIFVIKALGVSLDGLFGQATAAVVVN